MTILESLSIDWEEMKATTKNGVSIKGTRKLINDQLKETTMLKGAWTVWYDYDDGEKYHFTLSNPLYGVMFL